MRPQFTPQFADDVRRHSAVKKRLAARVRELSASRDAAEQLGGGLRDELAGCRSVHVGRDYRLVYCVRGDVIWFIALGPRQNQEVYRTAQQRLPGLDNGA